MTLLFHLTKHFFCSATQQNVSPAVLYAILGVCAGIILVLVIGGVFLIRCKVCKKSEPSQAGGHSSGGHQSNNKSYLVTDPGNLAQREKLNPPPPDLWIGHDQLELKELDGDETGDTSIAARSTPDYRSTIDRSRNYIQAYSGTINFTNI